MTEPLSEPPAEEGNDQEAAQGIEVPGVTETDLEDAPKDSDPVEPEDEGV